MQTDVKGAGQTLYIYYEEDICKIYWDYFDSGDDSGGDGRMQVEKYCR